MRYCYLIQDIVPQLRHNYKLGKCNQNQSKLAMLFISVKENAEKTLSIYSRLDPKFYSLQ